MPTSSASSSSGDLPMALFDDPKSLFHRRHRVLKYYSGRPHYIEPRGVLFRGLDARHAEPIRPPQWVDGVWTIDNTTKATRRFLARRTVSYPSRLRIINDCPFGVAALNVGYSLSKRKRWLLPELFEANAHRLQYPEERIETTMVTGENPFDIWPVGRIGSYRWSWRASPKVKRLVACNPDGSLYVRENRQSRGHLDVYLEPLDSPKAPEIPANRKLSKRRRRQLEAQCQKDPVRITYYAVDPKVSLNLLDSPAYSRWNDGYERKISKGLMKTRRFFPEDVREYASREEEPGKCVEISPEECYYDELDTMYAPPELMTLGDFIEDARLLDLLYFGRGCDGSDFELISLLCSENSADEEDYVIVN